MIRLLAILFLLSMASGAEMSLYVAGNATGAGMHNSSLEADGANVTGNGSEVNVIWEDDLYGFRPSM